MIWWLISNDDMMSIREGLIEAAGYFKADGLEFVGEHFRTLLHRLDSGLHTTDATPADFKETIQMINIQKHLGLLGLKVKDRVTGLGGVVTSVSFDLYGCIQAVVNPGTDEKGQLREVFWFDVSRLETVDPRPVMDRPNFEFGPVAEGKQGAAEKPGFLPQDKGKVERGQVEALKKLNLKGRDLPPTAFRYGG